jgi:hypothetical protein
MALMAYPPGNDRTRDNMSVSSSSGRRRRGGAADGVFFLRMLLVDSIDVD